MNDGRAYRLPPGRDSIYGRVPFNHGARGHAPISSTSSMKLLKLPNSAKDAIVGGVQHPRSYARIQEIEAPRPAPVEIPDAPKEVRFTFFVGTNLKL